MNNPRRRTGISVIIPVFNGERFLAAAITSVQQQTRPADEIIVVDDGSTDRSGEIVRSFGPGITYLRQDNQGPASARNSGVEISSGKILAFLDADDLWLPQKLARQVAWLGNMDEGIVLCRFQPILAPGANWPAAFNRDYFTSNPVCVLPSGLLLTHRTWLKIGPFDPAYRTGEDAEWFFRARGLATTERVVPEVLVQKRFHDANLSRQGSAQDLLSGLRSKLKSGRS